MQHSERSLAAFERAPLWTAVAAFIFDGEKYLRLANSHLMAVNLEAPDLAKLYCEGTFPTAAQQQSWAEQAAEGRSQLLAALRISFSVVAVAMGISVAVLWAVGKVSPSYPVVWGKVLSASGTFLIVWAALFELGEVWASWDRVALHELVRPKLFTLLFAPGILLATIGQLW